GLARLLGVDQDVLARRIGLGAAEAEQQRTPVQVGVGALRELDTRRMALGLERPRRDSSQLPGVGRLEARLVEQVLAPEHREEDVEHRHPVLPPLDRDQRPRGRESERTKAETYGNRRKSDGEEFAAVED